MRGLIIGIVTLAAAAGCTHVDKAEDLNFGTCAAVLKALAKNPSSARIPRARAIDIGDGHVQYDWRHGDGLALQNGFGAMIDTTASCVLNNGALWILVLNDDRRYVSGPEFDLLALAAANYRTAHK
jgi:hypothetical protein